MNKKFYIDVMHFNGDSDDGAEFTLSGKHLQTTADAEATFGYCCGMIDAFALVKCDVEFKHVKEGD